MAALAGNLLAASNVILALLVALYQGLALWRCWRLGWRWRWLRILHITLALYWAGVYVFVLLEEPGAVDPVWFGQVFVRPAFTVTLGLMAASAIQRSKQ